MRILAAALIAILAASAPLAATPHPPKQPPNGPGSADYPHGAVRESQFGEGATQYWIFEPQKPRPATAPLVIFLHGYSAMDPDAYYLWITHIARRGCIVVYPRYQSELLTPPDEYHANTVKSVRSALRVLDGKDRVKPDLDRIAIIGHSAGGVGAVTWAASAAEEKLPTPKAVMAVHPGQGPENGVQLVPLADCSKIPATTRLVLMASAEDKFVGLGSARRIWTRTGHVLDRAFITIAADKHGSPALVPRHLAPLAADRLSTDALDWHGYWRVFDDLCESAFRGAKLAITPGMGTWSDGMPVKPLTIER